MGNKVGATVSVAHLYKVVECPIGADVSLVVALSVSLGKALRKLRRDLRLCERCQKGEDCPLRQVYQSKVQAAIAQVQDEWNLTPAGNLVHAQLNYE